MIAMCPYCGKMYDNGNGTLLCPWVTKDEAERLFQLFNKTEVNKCQEQ